MKPTASKFLFELEHPKSRTFSIAFIGMSSIGKTKWSKHLGTKYRYAHIEIDSLIGRSDSFVSLLKDAPGASMTEKMGNYFGKPWDLGYPQKELAYLKIEAQCMAEPLNPCIVDLTGSAIYHPEQLRVLSKKALIIYLQDDPKQVREMIQTYLKHPKPVCWQGIFERPNGESNAKALERCYPLLLKHRQKLYEKHADVVVPWHHHSQDDLALFVRTVQKQLS